MRGHDTNSGAPTGAPSCIIHRDVPRYTSEFRARHLDPDLLDQNVRTVTVPEKTQIDSEGIDPYQAFGTIFNKFKLET